MEDVIINTLEDILEEMEINKNKYNFNDDKYLEYTTKWYAMEVAINKLKSLN